MNSFRSFCILLALGLCCVGSVSTADQMMLPDCDNAEVESRPKFLRGPDCTIAWVDNNDRQTIVWTQVNDELEETSLHQIGGEYPVLTSSHLPDLIDVDQDGWLDLMTFTPVAQVNGTFDIFFYNPIANQFKHAEPVWGHTLERDELGFIVATGRSGPGWVSRFYDATNAAMTAMLEIEPYGLVEAGGQFGTRCDLSLGYQNPLRVEDLSALHQIPDADALIAYYCDDDPEAVGSGRTVFLQEDPAITDRVPRNTVFYCVLEGGTHAVTITNGPHSMFYAYGPLGGTPELDLSRPHNLVDIRFKESVGQSGSGDITFTNGPYKYVAYFSYEASDAGHSAITNAPSSPFPNIADAGGLVVYNGGDTTAPIFQKSCILERSYDGIFVSSDGQ